MTAFLVFPHHLFASTDVLREASKVIIVEEHLFFKQYAFHKSKLMLHRASMKYYAEHLERQGIACEYVECTSSTCDVRVLGTALHADGVASLMCYDPCDDWLERRMKSLPLPVRFLPTPGFLNDADAVLPVRKDGSIVQTDWYVAQRKSRGVLMENGKPAGGAWTYDAENRKRYPRGVTPPFVRMAEENAWTREARQYVQKHFADNPGEMNSGFYPVTHAEAEKWLDDFLVQRFREFGPYEDAIVAREHWLHHSVLTPMLNTGLLTPDTVLDRALGFAQLHDVPLASLEGFVRQVMGWREFIRLFYVAHGRTQRTRNHWGFHRPIPKSWYDATTGILPIDVTIAKLLRTGYNHHIERLMILGNFMLLCRFDPDEVYRWFMEMYIDAYDWVMVPNVYGMSQFADGGMMCTKPYISGSNYVTKMSDFKADGHWNRIWDALFWRFMHDQREFFGSNPRLGMLLKTLDRMPAAQRDDMWNTAAAWDRELDAA